MLYSEYPTVPLGSNVFKLHFPNGDSSFDLLLILGGKKDDFQAPLRPIEKDISSIHGGLHGVQFLKILFLKLKIEAEDLQMTTT